MSQLVSRSNTASRIAGIIAFAIAIILVATPWWGSIATERLVGEFMVYLTLASLWNLLAGYTGLVSVGQQVFVGIGAYVLIALALLAGWNPIYAVPLSGIVAALIALPVGKLVFRLHGAYFAIGTWVIAEAIRLFVAQIVVLGGGSGISLPNDIMKMVGATKFWREATIYWLALALGLGTLAIVYALLRSRLGLALTAIRDNQLASESLGVRIERIKFAVYVLVAGITGMIGALVELQKVRMSPDSGFSVNDWTAFVIFIVVIGGIGTIEGPIVGTLLFFVLREYLSDLGSVYLLILGALAIITMVLAPKGIWGFIKEKFGLNLFPTSYHVNLDEK
jgi:branched-chain amino acid transport system permease protein